MNYNELPYNRDADMSEIMPTIRGLLGITQKRQDTAGQRPEPRLSTLDLLPFDVRYALQYREGMMGREEIGQLARIPSYQEAAFYLSARALRNDPEQQRAHLLRHVKALASEKSDSDTILQELLASIQELPADITVDGSKLGEVSRQGPKLRAAAYENIAKTVQESHENPVLVAHAALEGLHTFFPRFPQLHIVSPHWFNRKGFPIGYVISTGETAEVAFLEDKSHLPERPVFVDDTLNEGTTKNAINGFMGVPTDFRVINTVTSGS